MSKKKDRNPLKKARKKQQKLALKRSLGGAGSYAEFDQADSPVSEIDSSIPEVGSDASEIKEINFTVTWDPIIDEDNVPLSPEVEKIRADIYDQMNQPAVEIQPIIEQLEALCQQYPDDRTFANYLAAAYLRHDEKEKGIQKIKDNFAARPDYLFAKYQLAEVYIEDGLFEQVKDLFDNKWNLKLLCPEREVFHISEVRSFTYIQARYAEHIGNYDWFNLCCDMLRDLDPDCSELIKLLPYIMKVNIRSLMSGHNVMR